MKYKNKTRPYCPSSTELPSLTIKKESSQYKLLKNYYVWILSIKLRLIHKTQVDACPGAVLKTAVNLPLSFNLHTIYYDLGRGRIERFLKLLRVNIFSICFVHTLFHRHQNNDSLKIMFHRGLFHFMFFPYRLLFQILNSLYFLFGFCYYFLFS